MAGHDASGHAVDDVVADVAHCTGHLLAPTGSTDCSVGPTDATARADSLLWRSHRRRNPWLSGISYYRKPEPRLGGATQRGRGQPSTPPAGAVSSRTSTPLSPPSGRTTQPRGHTHAPATDDTRAWSNLASPVKVAPANPALPGKVASSNQASRVKVAPSNPAVPVKVVSLNQASPVKVARLNPVWVKVARLNQSLG